MRKVRKPEFVLWVCDSLKLLSQLGNRNECSCVKSDISRLEVLLGRVMEAGEDCSERVVTEYQGLNGLLYSEGRTILPSHAGPNQVAWCCTRSVTVT